LENTTFTIQEPLKFDCYKNHQYPTASRDKISVVIQLHPYFWDRTKKRFLTPVTLEVNPNTTPFPVTMVASMPNNKDFIAGVEVTIEGLQCSECANGYGDPAEPSNSCPNQTIPNTSPQKWQAAKPRWFLSKDDIQTYQQAITLGKADRIPNIKNTCNSGCWIE
jgi:hypothetical protein